MDPAAVIDHGESNHLQGRVVAGFHGNCGGNYSQYGADGIFEEIDEDPLDLFPVETEGGDFATGLEDEADIFMPFLVENQGFADQFIEIVQGRIPGRHPGKVRKFIDQILQFVDLGHDHARAFVKNLVVIAETVEIAAPQTLRRELDGGQGDF